MNADWRYTDENLEKRALCLMCCVRNGEQIDSSIYEFCHYFTSNGWKVGGRAPMKDWKASFRNWCRNARNQPATKKQNTPANAQNGTVSASMRAVMIKDSLKRCEAAISEIEDKYDYHRDPTQEERQQLKILKTERKQLEQQQRELLAA